MWSSRLKSTGKTSAPLGERVCALPENILRVQTNNGSRAFLILHFYNLYLPVTDEIKELTSTTLSSNTSAGIVVLFMSKTLRPRDPSYELFYLAVRGIF